MNAKHNVKSGIEQQIRSISMSEDERQQVLNQARIAEAFVDAIVWVCNQAQRLSAEGFAKPSPKY